MAVLSGSQPIAIGICSPSYSTIRMKICFQKRVMERKVPSTLPRLHKARSPKSRSVVKTRTLSGRDLLLSNSSSIVVSMFTTPGLDGLPSASSLRSPSSSNVRRSKLFQSSGRFSESKTRVLSAVSLLSSCAGSYSSRVRGTFPSNLQRYLKRIHSTFSGRADRTSAIKESSVYFSRSSSLRILFLIWPIHKA